MKTTVYLGPNGNQFILNGKHANLNAEVCDSCFEENDLMLAGSVWTIDETRLRPRCCL